MTALLGTVAAVFFGASDFLGGIASRRVAAVIVTLIAQLVGLMFFIAVALGSPGAVLTQRDLILGVAAGVAGGTGVLSLYAGLATGRMSVVAPITAALSGSLPAVVSALRGETVPPVGIAGILLALAAVVLVSIATPDEGEGPEKLALLFSVIAGVGFAASMLCYAGTTKASGILPLIPARSTTVTLLVILALIRGTGFSTDARTRVIAIFAGAVDACANWALLVALRLGPVAIASVISSLYPVTTVVLARVVLEERVKGIQRAGMILALAAVIMSALA
jgi:drug/metabolite transporter (DMT)-like permease